MWMEISFKRNSIYKKTCVCVDMDSAKESALIGCLVESEHQNKNWCESFLVQSGLDEAIQFVFVSVSSLALASCVPGFRLGVFSQFWRVNSLKSSDPGYSKKYFFSTEDIYRLFLTGAQSATELCFSACKKPQRPMPSSWFQSGPQSEAVKCFLPYVCFLSISMLPFLSTGPGGKLLYC